MSTWLEPMALLCLQSLYLAFPVMLAAAFHMLVIRRDWLRGLKVPIDGGLTLGGRRLFGDNKTWRGAVVMIAGAALGMALQQQVHLPRLERLDYRGVNAWAVGALLGAGFVLGELPNSFVKRRCGVAPGQIAEGPRYWLFTALDQLDSVVGALVAVSVVWVPPWPVVAATLFCGSAAHVAFNVVFVWIGLKRRAL